MYGGDFGIKNSTAFLDKIIMEEIAAQQKALITAELLLGEGRKCPSPSLGVERIITGVWFASMKVGGSARRVHLPWQPVTLLNPAHQDFSP